jgi:tripartite-type tricarboxylate transporter receptor subunit TctC
MKRKKSSQLTVFTLCILCGVALVVSAWAADYPKRGITVVVSWPAGSATGITAQKVVNIINQNKICPTAMQVVFKPGGAGTIGLSEVLLGNPDGYNLAFNPSAPLIVQPLIKDLPYTSKTFIPIIETAKFDWFLTVKDDAPWKNIQEFIEYVKQHPNEVMVGTAGDYTWAHIALLNISKAAGLKFRHVPFAGSAPAVISLLGGHINAAILMTGDISTQIAAGKARFLSSTETQRSKFYPDVPTFNDVGFPVPGSYHTNIIVAPKGTPEETIIILQNMFKKAVETDEYKDFLKTIGAEYKYMGYKELPAALDAESNKIAVLLEELGTEIKKAK